MLLTPVVQGLALYAAPQAPGQLTYLYFVAQNLPVNPPTFIQLSDSWNLTTWVGWYVLLTAPVDASSVSSFLQAALPNLPQLNAQNNDRGVVWAVYTGAFTVTVQWTCKQAGLGNPVPRAMNGPTIFSWSGLSVSVSPNVVVNYVAAVPNTTPDLLNLSLTISTAMSINFYGSAASSLTSLTVPLEDLQPTPAATPFTTGALTFSTSLNFASLSKNFGCALNYFYGKEVVNQLTYPFLTFSNTPPTSLPFYIQLHPLFPTNTSCTFLGYFPGQFQPALQANYFATPSGEAIQLTSALNLQEFPYPGFALSVRPSAASPGEPEYYLSPCGTWTVTIPKSGQFNWMMGLFAQEYLIVTSGAAVDLIPNLPAYASSVQDATEPRTPHSPGTGSPAGKHPLHDTYTTSWVQFRNATPSYFGQPSASVYYSPAGPRFPLAIDAQLAPNIVAATPFPVAPYLGLTASSSVDLDAMQAVESSALTTTRHTQLIPQGTVPLFRSALSQSSAIAAQTLTDAMTPQGFVANLNGDGSWSKLVLAIGDQGTELTISGPGSPAQIDALLASTLLQNDLSLVISDFDKLAPFGNQITIEDFTFSINRGVNSVLVFKFNPSISLVDMIGQPNLWAATPEFVGDEAAVDAVQQKVLEAIASAAKIGGPFTSFNSIVQTPSWTGVLAFDCEIEGGTLPLSLQMLLGGISGQLQAHHLGIQSNRVTPNSPGLQIVESSLFGVIYYEAPAASPPAANAPDFDYEVLQLIVVFSNSKITQFHTTVGLTINKLFGRELALAPSASPPPIPNTLQITGQFQDQNGVPSVSFFSHSPTVFRFPRRDGGSRVLEQIVINQASLTPISETPLSPGNRIAANFALGGQLWFSRDPFPNAGVDLFSYGNDASHANGGAPFTGFNVALAFSLDKDGHLIPKSKTVQQTGLLTLTPTPESIRPGSLLGNLPLRLTSLRYSATGLTSSSTGAYPVHCLQLESGGAPAGSPGSPASPPVSAPQSPFTTTSPIYALEFDMPLGSLGALSDVHAGLIAKLLIGWGPSPLVPDEDACGLMVQLPSLTAGYKGFNLQGIIGTKFGDANLLQVMLPGETLPVYAIMFNNVQLSVFGFGFPPGLMVDFLLFAGPSDSGSINTNTNNIAWYLGAYQTGGSPT